ncbi:MAG: SPOR domain-containing protein, partial [Rhodobacteraceae bacterium]|nr:SPOR domain-containing protein [Paracoccaceae bacterium]
MTFLRFCVLLLGLLGSLAPAFAQDRVWVQVEAQPTLPEAETRARAFAAAFPNVTGYRLRSGWYAILLGPYGVEEGAAALAALRRENLIPRDAFLAYGSDFRDQFWPAAGSTPPAATDDPLLTPPATTADVTPQTTPAATPEAAPPVLLDETPEQARASEAELSRPDREELQTALKWFGFYA